MSAWLKSFFYTQIRYVTRRGECRKKFQILESLWSFSLICTFCSEIIFNHFHEYSAFDSLWSLAAESAEVYGRLSNVPNLQLIFV